eukprot:2517987-Pyramimonas_sp.AAC.1
MALPKRLRQGGRRREQKLQQVVEGGPGQPLPKLLRRHPLQGETLRLVQLSGWTDRCLRLLSHLLRLA